MIIINVQSINIAYIPIQFYLVYESLRKILWNNLL